ncbi:hypothetical protein RI570_11685 [Brucella pseudogrignonensis]|uniref:hypothetical protein n=1 Tax=Brucella pseudogrignonensis TaxID=419475 RepID=UPI0028BB9A49|nr:hypothetical protein [Brucella pseudogrignonensis]MDT6940809.1 hypothetical protein [Brucella pseudogrignonensis]
MAVDQGYGVPSGSQESSGVFEETLASSKLRLTSAFLSYNNSISALPPIFVYDRKNQFLFGMHDLTHEQ